MVNVPVPIPVELTALEDLAQQTANSVMDRSVWSANGDIRYLMMPVWKNAQQDIVILGKSVCLSTMNLDLHLIWQSIYE